MSEIFYVSDDLISILHVGFNIFLLIGAIGIPIALIGFAFNFISKRL